MVYPDRLTAAWYPALLVLGLFSGCGIATFSVGISQVAYWRRQREQGRALAIYAGLGNAAPGLFTIVLPFALARWGLATSLRCVVRHAGRWDRSVCVHRKELMVLPVRGQGATDPEARRHAGELGQELFPARNPAESLRTSASCWKTWALVLMYFTTFGGFIALTAWLPIYYTAVLRPDSASVREFWQALSR